MLSTEGAIVPMESGAAADLMPVESPEPGEPPKKKKLKPAKVTGHAALAIVLDTMDKRSAAKKVEEASPAAGTKVMKKPGMAAAQKVLKKPAAAGTKVMKKLDHPNLVKMFEVIDAPDTNTLNIVLECVLLNFYKILL